MRTIRIACCCLLAPLALSACGGSQAVVDQVPKTAPSSQPLADADSLASAGTGTASTTTGTSTSAAPTTQPTTAAPATGGTTPAPSSGGTAAPVTPAPTTPAPATQAPSSGGAAAPAPGTQAPSANAGSTKQFCQDNPGAC